MHRSFLRCSYKYLFWTHSTHHKFDETIFRCMSPVANYIILRVKSSSLSAKPTPIAQEVYSMTIFLLYVYIRFMSCYLKCLSINFPRYRYWLIFQYSQLSWQFATSRLTRTCSFQMFSGSKIFSFLLLWPWNTISEILFRIPPTKRVLI